MNMPPNNNRFQPQPPQPAPMQPPMYEYPPPSMPATGRKSTEKPGLQSSP